MLSPTPSELAAKLDEIKEQLREIRWQQYVILSYVFVDHEGGGANSARFPPVPENFK